VVGAKAPKLISDDLVGRMNRWARYCRPSRWTRRGLRVDPADDTPDPTFEVNGSLFYCVANMPGAVPHSSTHALVNATLLTSWTCHPRLARRARADAALAEGSTSWRLVVYEPVAAAHGLKTVPLDSFLD